MATGVHTSDGAARELAGDYDVLIVGAGLSGIGAARYLARELPHKSYAIVEARGASGGTWDLFRYPGIRSDSDLHTYGYAFKPWRDEQSIAAGPAILEYIRETAREHDIDRHIHYGLRVVAASWSSETARWTVELEGADGTAQRVSCSWLIVATGYFRYDQGHQPAFPGVERFGGTLVHPQHWPAELDFDGRRVVVIGSGATAVTLVPALAGRAAHVTMLQRSPSYVISLPARDGLANLLGRLLPAERAYAITRRKNIWLQRTVYRLSRSQPKLVARLLRRGVERRLPPGYDVEKHFTPSYSPWDQRLCAVPDGDLFAAISSGRASVATDRIATFTESGIALESGEHLEADVIVTATGLELEALGGIELTVDGQAVPVPGALIYKSVMLGGAPNLAFVFGYTNASWTLKLDLVCEYLCRLIRFMDRRGYESCVPVNGDATMETRPFLDLDAGYVRRAQERLPLQGTGAWEVKMSYEDDARRLREGAVDDGILRFGRVAAPALASLAAAD